MSTIRKETVMRLRRVAARAIAPNGRFDDDLYRVWLSTEFGVTSTLHLTEAQGQRAVQLLTRGPQAPRHPHAPQSDTSTFLLSHRQAWRIGSEEERLGWKGQPHRLIGFASRVLTRTVDDIRLLTKSEASRLITALHKVKPDKVDETQDC